MSQFTSKKTQITGIGEEDAERILNRLLCAPDLEKNFTWTEIDGVYRVTEIVYTSAFIDADEEQTIVFTKTFVYEGADPFNLERIDRSLVVT